MDFRFIVSIIQLTFAYKCTKHFAHRSLLHFTKNKKLELLTFDAVGKSITAMYLPHERGDRSCA
ncbi:hypothetical protein EGI32_03765 [Ferruginibacter sp. HRS2-29]|nr:hypothetical protein [Ferruginibacter sp. HRS2-29]